MSYKTAPKAKLKVNKPLLNTIEGIEIFQYSEKSIVLVGENTKHLKEHLGPQGMGGGWNKWLTDDDGNKFSGWIFPKSQLKQVTEFLESVEWTEEEGE